MSEAYQYKVEEKSLSQGFLLKFVWNPIVERLPRRLTPNTITVLSAIFMLTSALFVWLALHGSTYGFLVAAVFVFLYMAGDNVDGPHARRTGQSSKLGEFLDHWLDSFNSVVINLCLALALHLEGWLLLTLMAAVALAFFATIWEHHHTGVFHSGRLGTNEALLLIIALYTLLFFAPQDASWVYYRPGTLSLAAVMAYFSLLACLVTIGGTVWRVRSHFSDFLPILFIVGTILGWGLTDQLATVGLGVGNPFATYLAALGILAANVLFSGPLLLDRLAHKPSPYRAWVTSGLAVVGIVFLLSVLFEWPLIRIFFAVPVSKKELLCAIGVLYLLTALWDLVRAVKALPGPQKK